MFVGGTRSSVSNLGLFPLSVEIETGDGSLGVERTTSVVL